MKLSKLWKGLCLMLSLLMLFSACQNSYCEQEQFTQSAETTAFFSNTESPLIDDSFASLCTTYRDYADVAIDRLINAFWDADENHFLRTGNGRPSPTSMSVWEQGQSLYALATYYEATKDPDALKKIKQQWAYLTSDAYDQEVLKGAKELGTACYDGQDDAAWCAQLFLEIYRATGNRKALDYAYTLIVSAYNYWGTGEIKNYCGTSIKSMTDGMYYTFRLKEGESLFRSIYAAPMAVTALEYCLIINPEDPTAVDLYAPTLNLFQWMEDNLCRSKTKTYKNYNENGSLTVSYVDYLYYVDYGRYGENGPTGANNPQKIELSGANTALFGNMGMAAAAAMLYRITGNDEYRNIAVRTVKAITKYETHETTNTYINDRDQGTNASMVGYFVRYALSLDGVRDKDKQILLNTAELIVTTCEVNIYYYTAWDEAPASHRIFYPSNTNTRAFTCQPRMATCVHMVTAALLLLSME